MTSRRSVWCAAMLLVSLGGSRATLSAYANPANDVEEAVDRGDQSSARGQLRDALVAYQVALVRASDRAVLVTDRFDYTQQSLSENLLDLPRFLKAGGRWMTREEILEGALDETARKLATSLAATAPARRR